MHWFKIKAYGLPYLQYLQRQLGSSAEHRNFKKVTLESSKLFNSQSDKGSNETDYEYSST